MRPDASFFEREVGTAVDGACFAGLREVLGN